jgi:hypothetical protein
MGGRGNQFLPRQAGRNFFYVFTLDQKSLTGIQSPAQTTRNKFKKRRRRRTSEYFTGKEMGGGRRQQ